MLATVDWSWLINALSLPTRIFVGLFLSSILILLFDSPSIVNLAAFGQLARPTFIICAALFGCLSLTSLVALGYKLYTHAQKRTQLQAAHQERRLEQAAKQEEYEEAVLKRLDYLSKDELHYVAKCLHNNEQSFLGYAHSGPISNLEARGIVTTPGGPHHQDHYPYLFVDFVWKALLDRKQEFITKYKELEQKEKQKKQSRRTWP